MADVTKLKASIEKAEAKVEKCKGTIERHEKALEKKIAVLVKAGYSREQIETDLDSIKWPKNAPQTHYWEACEVESKKNDIKGAKSKLEDAEEVLANWKAKLDKEEAKDDFVKANAPQAIIDFLEKWKEMAYDWHVKRYEETHALKIELNKKVMEAEAELVKSANGKYILTEERNAFMKARKLDYSSVKKQVGRKAGSAVVLNMLAIRKEAERLKWLDELLEQDKRAKLIDLIHRVNEVVGEITDAGGLKVNAKGNLDGFIVGKDGKAEVETIGAGGYNIVCFHYRTLVKPVK